METPATPPEVRPKVRIARPDEHDVAINTLVAGFVADPIVRWLFPDAHVYLSAVPQLKRAFGGRAFDHDSAWLANDGHAAALWLPPGVEPDSDMMMAVLQANLPEDRLAEAFTMFAEMDAAHPKEPCWYLPMIAADPAHVGQGLGAELMKHALARVDADHMPAYLESSNPRNISLYERHGFDVMHPIQVGTIPVMTPMVRAAR